LDHDPKIHRP